MKNINADSWFFIGLSKITILDIAAQIDGKPHPRRFTLNAGHEAEMRRYFKSSKDHNHDMLIGELYSPDWRLIDRFDHLINTLRTSVKPEGKLASAYGVFAAVGKELLSEEIRQIITGLRGEIT